MISDEEYEMRFSVIKALKGFKLKKNTETEIIIDSVYSFFIQLDEEGDSLYVSINKTINGEMVNAHRINCFLSVEDNNFTFEIIKEKFNEVDKESLTELEIGLLDSILRMMESRMNTEYKDKLRELSGLYVGDEDTKFVWLNIMEGFSNTWREGDLGFNSLQEFLCSMSDGDVRKDQKNWKLIEYKCHTDNSFEFNNNMKLK